MGDYVERKLLYGLFPPSGIQRLHVADIDLIPAADVRPVVRGRWTRIDYEPCGHDYKCSACGWKNEMATNFCPNCGARMKGAEDGTTD